MPVIQSVGDHARHHRSGRHYFTVEDIISTDSGTGDTFAQALSEAPGFSRFIDNFLCSFSRPVRMQFADVLMRTSCRSTLPVSIRIPCYWRFAVANAHLIHFYRGHLALDGAPVEAFKACLFRKQLMTPTIYALVTRELHTYVCGSAPVILSFTTQSFIAL
jgi:hypothetical protein